MQYYICKIYNLYNIWEVELAKTQYLQIVLHRGFFRVDFTDFLVFVNYIYNWKTWHHTNGIFKQFYCGYGYVCTANVTGLYTKL